MSVPSDPRDPLPPTRRQPAVPPPSVEPSGYADPRYAAPVPVAPGDAAYPEPAPVVRPVASSRLVIDAGRYWAGVVATAVVGALIGAVGVLVVEQIIDIQLVTQSVFSDSHTAEYTLGGAVAGLVAGVLLYLLAIAAPRPTAFFGWIMALATVVAALLPFTWTHTTERAVATGLLNLVMGIAIWSLLSGVLAWTGRLQTTTV